VDGRLLNVNAAACNLVGYNEAELCGDDAQGLAPWDGAISGSPEAERLRAGEIEQYRSRAQLVHKNGHCVAASLNVFLLATADDKPRLAVVRFEHDADEPHC